MKNRIKTLMTRIVKRISKACDRYLNEHGLLMPHSQETAELITKPMRRHSISTVVVFPMYMIEQIGNGFAEIRARQRLCEQIVDYIRDIIPVDRTDRTSPSIRFPDTEYRERQYRTKIWVLWEDDEK